MQNTYNEIITELSKIMMIDTHEHLRFGHMINFETLQEEEVPLEANLRKIIFGSYMGAPLAAAAAGAGLANLDDRESLLQALRLTANTSSYRCDCRFPCATYMTLTSRTLIMIPGTSWRLK